MWLCRYGFGLILQSNFFFYLRNEWISISVLELVKINRFRLLICRNSMLVSEFNRHSSNSSLHLISPLGRLMCQPLCCVVISICPPRVQGPFCMKRFKFHFSLSIFHFSSFTHPVILTFHSETSNRSPTLLIPAKTIIIFISPKAMIPAPSIIIWRAVLKEDFLVYEG